MPNKVIVAGPSGSGKSFIVASMAGEKEESVKASRKAVLELRTKYYHADVNVELARGSAPPSDAKARQSLLENCQGVVLVFDKNSEAGVESIKAWEGFLNETPEASVLLLAANAATEGKKAATDAPQTGIDATLEWALDRGMELVAVSRDDAEKFDENTQEKLGCARILEALSTTMWTDMKLLDRRRGGAAPQGRSSTGVGQSGAAISQVDSKAFKNRVIIAGCSPKHRLDAVTALQKQLWTGLPSSAPSASAPPPRLGSSSQFGHVEVSPAVIRTKYYTASVNLVSLADVVGDAASERISAGCKALVLLVDPRRVSKWTAFSKILVRLGEFLEAHEPDSALCIALGDVVGDVKASTGATGQDDGSSDAMQRLRDWCVDNGVEMVDSPEQASRAETAWGRRPASGLTRVAEALQCVQWDDMARATAPSKKPTPSTSPVYDGVLAADTRGGTSTKSSGKERAEAAAAAGRDASAAAAAPTCAAKTEDAAEGQAAWPKSLAFALNDRVEIQGLLAKAVYNGRKGAIIGYIESKSRYVVALDSTMGDPSSRKINVKAANIRQEPAADPAAEKVESFDRMLQKIARVRDNSKNLPDGERRKLAEQTVMQLVSMLGGGDDKGTS